MAFDNPLDVIPGYDLDALYPIIPWTATSFDGVTARSAHDASIAARDDALLGLIQAIYQQSVSNTSPLYPFKDDATLVPSSATPQDASGAPIPGFVINPATLALPKSFIKDMRLVLANEFINPFISQITFIQQTDPATGLLQVFVNIYISATYTIDQNVYVIMSLENQAYNDVQDGSAPSSRDNLPLQFKSLPVQGLNFLNTGDIEFGFIGAIESSQLSSWSVGTYQGATVEGFANVANLNEIIFTFVYAATKITQLAYTNLGNLQDVVPFLVKVKFYPFDPASTAGSILQQAFVDCQITAPVKHRVFIKRIRLMGTTYIVMFAYNRYDSHGNYVGTVNIGKCYIPQNSPRKTFPIIGLGSNTVNGVAPNWADEQPTFNTKDSYGEGTLTILSYAAIQQLFIDLLAATVNGSPIVGSPVIPPQVVGITVDQNVILMLEANSFLDGLACDTIAIPTTIVQRPLNPALHPTLNVQITVGGFLVNRRISYGIETTMRDFYGIGSAESLINNPKINLEDEWFDTSTNTLKRYQIVSGRNTWRVV